MLECSKQRKKRDWHRQKVYVESFIDHVSEAVDQVVGRPRSFVQNWEPEKPELSSECTESESKVVRKQKVLHQPRRDTRVGCVLSVNYTFIYVERAWFTEDVGEQVGRIYDCHILEVTEDFGAVKLLGTVVHMKDVRIRSTF